jgi:hypothetical protein
MGTAAFGVGGPRPHCWDCGSATCTQSAHPHTAFDCRRLVCLVHLFVFSFSQISQRIPSSRDGSLAPHRAAAMARLRAAPPRRVGSPPPVKSAAPPRSPARRRRARCRAAGTWRTRGGGGGGRAVCGVRMRAFWGWRDQSGTDCSWGVWRARRRGSGLHGGCVGGVVRASGRARKGAAAGRREVGGNQHSDRQRPTRPTTQQEQLGWFRGGVEVAGGLRPGVRGAGAGRMKGEGVGVAPFG